MKKKLLILLIFCFIILCNACNIREEGRLSDPIYRRITEEKNTSDEAMQLEISENTDNIPEENLNTNLLLNEFTGIIFEEASFVSSNFTINNKLSNKVCLVCPDDKNDAIYYINYGNHGKDNYIYQLKDGESNLLVGMPATTLQLWNDELYFLSTDKKAGNDISYIRGSIYKYNLDTGRTELIYDGNANWLYIDEDGIHFTQIAAIDKAALDQDITAELEARGINPDDETNGLTIEGFIEYYFMDFDDRAPQKSEYAEFIGYNGYLLMYARNDMNSGINNVLVYLLHRKTNEIVLKLSNAALNPEASIYKNNLYYIGLGQILYCLNLETGSYTVYDVSSFSNRGVYEIDGNLYSSRNIISGYTELNGEIFIATQNSYIYRGNYESNDLTQINVGDNAHYSLLFTSGDRLFAVKSYNIYTDNTHYLSLVELVIMDDGIIEQEIPR